MYLRRLSRSGIEVLEVRAVRGELDMHRAPAFRAAVIGLLNVRVAPRVCAISAPAAQVLALLGAADLLPPGQPGRVVPPPRQAPATSGLLEPFQSPGAVARG
ncbi:hypothetical protein [Paractinoplanes toevensis]|uniref:hypothetical protein n=1 Tax=Paractinoplanes toevensis TaxID=571911 RepID=UPI001BB34A91|nr:hypothetical protein [Actinoplanes toevensis]